MPAISSDDILTRIREKRADVERFLTGALPRKRRLLNTTIVGGSLAAAFTAGPAVGGAPFTAWLTMSLGLTSPSWRLLCGVASVASITATVATQVLKSNNLEQNISRAQTARARLEVLETSVTLGQIEPTQAATEFLKCVEDAAFLER
jgi:cytochrome bd-type quinol oxidase subunit 2